MIRLKHISNEQHEHHKEIEKAQEEIREESGVIKDVKHATVCGAYDRLMCSTIIIYEVPDKE